MAGNQGHCATGASPGLSEIHVWLVRLDSVRQHWPRWAEALAPEETARADRYLRAEDRYRFGATRAVLRRLLGEQLGLTPTEVRLEYNRFGKPGLPAPDNPLRLNISVSHSGDFALLGFARGRPLGVDLEAFRRDSEYRELAAAVCDEREVSALAALPKDERLPELLRYWTLKEAYVKALGVGLTFPHRRVGIGREGPDQPVRYTIKARGYWSVFPLDDIPGYAAAAIAWGRGITLRRREMVWN
jgi:4'-phosphopantetheinyl transferase